MKKYIDNFFTYSKECQKLIIDFLYHTRKGTPREKIKEAIIFYLLINNITNNKINIVREELADMAHIPTSTAIRILGAMEIENIVKLNGREIIIIDYKKLINFI